MAFTTVRKSDFITGFMVFCVAAVGCRREGQAPSSAPPADEPAIHDAAEEKAPLATSQDDPAASFRAIRDDLVAGRSEEILSVIPQQGRDAVTLWAGSWMSIDLQTRKAFLKSLEHSAKAVAAKEEFISGSEPLLFDGPWADLLNKHLASLARITASIANWPGWLATSRFETDSMIRAFVSAIAAEPGLVAALEQMEFETVSVSGDEGVVRYRTAQAEEWKTLAVSRREGFWLPSRFFEEWGHRADRPDSEPNPAAKLATEERLREMSTRLDELSATLESVSTQAEFDAMIEQAATRRLAEKQTDDMGKAIPRPIPPEQFAWVVVSGEFSAKEQDQLLWSLANRTDAPASTVADLRESEDGESVRIHLGPVADLQAFAGRLTGLAIDEVNDKQRTIRARIGPGLDR